MRNGYNRDYVDDGCSLFRNINCQTERSGDMSKKFNSIKESVEHTLNNTVFPDSIINYMAEGDKEFIKKMKARRETLTTPNPETK